MRITIAAVGRLRRGTEQDLFDHYARLIQWPIAVREVEESRPFPPPELKAREAELLRKAVPAGATVVALDGRGKQPTSPEFADRLARWRDDAVRDLAFLIGGADGLEDGLLGEAHYILSLGRLTWPHMMVRGMLAEQIYRGQQILANHPYHR
jgi:23S rRNA (pseudouridine1915-N3)-methyltransferase